MKTVGLFFNEGGIKILEPTLKRFKQETVDTSKVRGPALDAALRYVSSRLGTKVTASYSRMAGCSMCPCSPGFKLQVADVTPRVDELLSDTVDAYDRFVFHSTNGKRITTARGPHNRSIMS